MSKKTLTIKELSEYLGINIRTLYNMVEDGRFPILPIKNLYPRRWNIEEVDKWRLEK